MRMNARLVFCLCVGVMNYNRAFLYNGVSLQPEGIAIDSGFLLTFKGR